jgi:MFS family permease
VISPPVYITLPATFITGFGTSVVINTMLTKMSSHYGKAAEVAIPQANGIASVGFVTGTALIGTIAIAYPGLWRLGLLLALPVALILFFVGREKDAEEHVPDEHGPQGGKLSAKFWISWFGFVACISSEFATSFWAAALSEGTCGINRGDLNCCDCGSWHRHGNWSLVWRIGIEAVCSRYSTSCNHRCAVPRILRFLVIAQHGFVIALSACCGTWHLNAVCTFFDSFDRLKRWPPRFSYRSRLVGGGCCYRWSTILIGPFGR